MHPKTSLILEAFKTAQNIEHLYDVPKSSFTISTPDLQIHALDGLARKIGAEKITISADVSEQGATTTLEVHW